ncbi:MAG TPA: alpha/beta hydrolase [Jatrophihabitans sp.]|jgi:pimeloyl-ACP methyl ester carboxylesterase|uniref:alpha/beta fold hydrolase n=1 Tax=Jatrophihabitans sp. TaxID=1932789 RepID=UPI002EF36E39
MTARRAARLAAAGLSGPGWVTAEQVRKASGEPTMRIGFLHGLRENTRCWERVVALLPEDVDAWVFQLPWDGAHGDDWALERDPGVWIERALQQAPEPFTVLVAHSFGANVLLDYLDANGAPDELGLVLLAPFYRASREAFDWTLISYYLNDFHHFLASGMTARRTRPIDPDVLLGMSEKVRGWVGPYGWLRFFELFSRTPMLDLEALTLPCAVVGGELDVASYPADCLALADALPNATVEILPGCGHHLMLDAPQRVAVLIRELAQRRRQAA